MEALGAAVRAGARAVKWLPNAMGIPLLFDFVLKRRLRAGTARFGTDAFRTRPHLGVT